MSRNQSNDSTAEKMFFISVLTMYVALIAGCIERFFVLKNIGFAFLNILQKIMFVLYLPLALGFFGVFTFCIISMIFANVKKVA